MRTEQVYGFLNYDNGSTLCTASADVLSRKSGLGESTFYEIYMDGRDVTISVNDTGKNYMWPTPTCRPYQMRFVYDYVARGMSSDKTFVIDGVNLYNIEHSSNGSHTVDTGILTNNAILNSTRASNLDFKVHVGSTLAVMFCTQLNLYFDYYRYDHEARKANDARGVQSVNVRLAYNQEAVQVADAYHGDLVIYTPNLDPKANWRGWYADPEHTILVSTDINYIVEATSDLVLYAYATKRQDVDYKLNGEWKEGIVIYEKINGVWTEITKEQIKTDVGYELNRGG